MGALDIQLAIQGGGAKIVTLLPALEALQELEKRGIVRVRAIAGASAGSIAAAIFASRTPIAVIRAAMSTWSSDEVDELFPEATPYRILRMILGGKPLWDAVALGDLAARLLPQNVVSLSDLRRHSGIDLHVIVADLRGRRTMVLPQDNTPVRDALVDSCAIPFLVRTWSKIDQAVNVDGGICANLPTSTLNGSVATHGQVFAISLREGPSKNSPKSFFQFCAALLDTAIEASMESARKSLPSRQVLTLLSPFGTLEFQRAKNEGLENSEYGSKKKETLDFFEESVRQIQAEIATAEKSKKEQDAKLTDLENRLGSISKKLRLVYGLHHLPTKLKYKRLSLIVVAHSLSMNDRPSGIDDILTYRLVFSPAEDREVYCHHTFLELDKAAALSAGQESGLTLTDKEGNSLEAIPISIIDDLSGDYNSSFLFFSPPLTQRGAPYTLEMRWTAQDSARVLREKRSDAFEADLRDNRILGDIDKLEFVIAGPVDPGLKLDVSLDDDAPTMTGSTGRRMTRKELDEHTQNVAAGFQKAGWIQENVPGGVLFPAKLRLISR